MKIHISNGELSAAASWAARISPSNPRVPITAGVLLSADDEGLRLSATDYDMFGSVLIPEALIPDGGSAVVSARLLAAITKTLRRDDEVLIESGTGSLEFASGRSQWELPELEMDFWPEFPGVGEAIGRVSAQALSRGLARVLPAVSVDSKTQWLTGVLFDTSKTLALAATDRYRLAGIDLEWQPAFSGEPRRLIVPADLLSVALAALGEGEVTIGSDGNTVSLTTERHQITSRLIDGQYPNWRPFIDEPLRSSITTMTVSVDALTQAVTRVSAVCGGDSKTPDLLRVEVGEDGIGITLAGRNAAKGRNFAKAHSWHGEPLAVGLTPKYLLDALAALGSPMGELRFIGQRKGFLLRAADEQGDPLDDGYGHVLMPRQLTEAKVAA